MGRFEDRLISDLMGEHGPALAAVDRPEPTRRSHRPMWMVAGALSVAAAAAVGFTLAGGGAGAAQAVTMNPNGTVTVTLKDLSQADEANVELAKLGVPIRVVDMDKLHCPGEGLVHDTSDHRATRVHVDENYSITVSANDVPKGDTLILTAIQRPPSRTSAVELGMQVIQGSTPVCATTPEGGK